MTETEIKQTIKRAIDESAIQHRVVPVVLEADSDIGWILDFTEDPDCDYFQENDGSYDCWGQSMIGNWRICVKMERPERKLERTPGPWEARKNSRYWEVGIPGHYRTVCDTCSSAPSNADGGLQEGNARLIAAAPEMLEFLEGLVESMEAGNFEFLWEKCDWKYIALRLIDQAKGIE
jgi:hypothetical protein